MYNVTIFDTEAMANSQENKTQYTPEVAITEDPTKAVSVVDSTHYVIISHVKTL